MQSRTNAYEWVNCWNCGRKLFRADTFCPKDETDRGKALVMMETKCHGCRAVNTITISRKGIEVSGV